MTSPSASSDALVDLRDHPLQRDYWWGSPEFAAAYGPLSINEIIARIGADLGVVGDFSVPVPLESKHRPDAEGLVLFVADADGTTKQWAVERWVELATAASGVEASTSPSSPVAKAATPWWIEDSPARGGDPG